MIKMRADVNENEKTPQQRKTSKIKNYVFEVINKFDQSLVRVTKKNKEYQLLKSVMKIGNNYIP